MAITKHDVQYPIINTVTTMFIYETLNTSQQMLLHDLYVL